MTTPALITDSLLERAPLILRDGVSGFFPTALRGVIDDLIAIVAILAVFGLLFAFLTLAERKILGRIQNRPGPNRTGPFGLLQPFADGIKMLTKEDIVPRAADQLLHFLAPVALVAFSLLTFAVIPYGRHLVPVDLDAGVLYFFAASASTELAVFMAGWASHNKYSLLAAMRALAQLISYELPLLLSIVPVVLAAGSLSPSGIVAAQGAWTLGVFPHWYVFTPWGFAGFVIFLISALAESNRSPFDLPEAESELVAGHLTEYSGFKYALFSWPNISACVRSTAWASRFSSAAGRRPAPFPVYPFVCLVRPKTSRAAPRVYLDPCGRCLACAWINSCGSPGSSSFRSRWPISGSPPSGS